MMEFQPVFSDIDGTLVDSNEQHVNAWASAFRNGVSPPRLWSNVPDGTTALALIGEDPDAPSSSPLVHAIVWDIPPDERRIPAAFLSRVLVM